MKIITTMVAGLLAFASAMPAFATVISFDLSNMFGASTPLSQTVNGLTATFSSPGDPGAFAIYNPGALTIGPNILADPGPAGRSGVPLGIGFSKPVANVTLQFATDGSGPFSLSAFSGNTLIGSTSTVGTLPAGHPFPEGTITFDAPGNKTFDSIVLTSPQTPFFAIANPTVSTAPCTAGTTIGASLPHVDVPVLLPQKGYSVSYGEKWPRLFEQQSPIYKWTQGGLRKVNRAAPKVSSYAASFI